MTTEIKAGSAGDTKIADNTALDCEIVKLNYQLFIIRSIADGRELMRCDSYPVDNRFYFYTTGLDTVVADADKQKQIVGFFTDEMRKIYGGKQIVELPEKLLTDPKELKEGAGGLSTKCRAELFTDRLRIHTPAGLQESADTYLADKKQSEVSATVKMQCVKKLTKAEASEEKQDSFTPELLSHMDVSAKAAGFLKSKEDTYKPLGFRAMAEDANLMVFYYEGILLGSVVWKILGNGPNIHLGDTFTNPNLKTLLAAEDPLLIGLSDTAPEGNSAAQLRSRIIAIMYAKVAASFPKPVAGSQSSQVLLIAPKDELVLFDDILKFPPLNAQLSGSLRIAAGSNSPTKALLALQEEQCQAMASLCSTVLAEPVKAGASASASPLLVSTETAKNLAASMQKNWSDSASDLSSAEKPASTLAASVSPALPFGSG